MINNGANPRPVVTTIDQLQQEPGSQVNMIVHTDIVSLSQLLQPIYIYIFIQTRGC